MTDVNTYAVSGFISAYTVLLFTALVNGIGAFLGLWSFMHFPTLLIVTLSVVVQIVFLAFVITLE